MADADLPPAPTRVRRLVLTLACGISFVLYLHRYTWGFIKKDVADEFGWDPVTLGWLDSLFGFSYGLGQIPSGILCDWFGAHALLGTIVLGWSLALAGTALAVGVISMAVARLAFGATQAGCYPVLNKVSKNWFPLDRRTTAQGLIATFFGRGGGAASYFLFGTVLVGWLGLPWRAAIGIFTLLGLATGALFLLLFRNTPRDHPWANRAEADLIVADDPTAAQATHARLNWPALVRSRNVWFLFLRGFMSNLADVLFVYWFPLYLRELKGIHPTHAGWMAALPILGGAVGGATSGTLQSALLRRTGSRRWVRSGVGLAGKLTAAGLVLLSLTADEVLAVVVILCVAKFFCDWEQPAEWGTISDIGGRSAATVFACVNTVGSFAGFVAGPVSGFVLQKFSHGETRTAAGWNALFAIVALEFVIAAASWLFIDCRQPIDPIPQGKTA
jgi:MFS family permease